jgi:hypothetical protein
VPRLHTGRRGARRPVCSEPRQRSTNDPPERMSCRRKMATRPRHLCRPHRPAPRPSPGLRRVAATVATRRLDTSDKGLF